VSPAVIYCRLPAWRDHHVASRGPTGSRWSIERTCSRLTVRPIVRRQPNVRKKPMSAFKTYLASARADHPASLLRPEWSFFL